MVGLKIKFFNNNFPIFVINIKTKNDNEKSRLRQFGHVMWMREERISKIKLPKNRGKTTKRKTQKQMDRPNQKVYRNEKEKLGRNARKYVVGEERLLEISL